MLLQLQPFRRPDAEYAAGYDVECPSKAVIDSHGDSQGYSGDCKTPDSSLCLILHLPAYATVPSILVQPANPWEEYRMEVETCIQASRPDYHTLPISSSSS